MVCGISTLAPSSLPLSCAMRSPPVMSPATSIVWPKKSFCMAYTLAFILAHFLCPVCKSFSRSGAAETPVAMQNGSPVPSPGSTPSSASRNSVSSRRISPTPFSSWLCSS